MQISKLQRGKKSNRINVYVADEYSFSIEESTLVKFGLYKDQILTNDLVKRIKDFDAKEKLIRTAQTYIARRTRSELEIRRYLLKKSKDIIQIGQVIQALKEQKLIDDEQYAKTLIEYRVGQKKKSKLEVEQELLEKGIDKEIYLELLERLYTKQNQSDLIEKLAGQKLESHKYKKEPRTKQKQKLIRYLAGKGFAIGEILEFLKNKNL